jgi:type I restriction enzyme S subunit
VNLPTGWRWLTPHQIAGEDKSALVIGPFGSSLKVSDYRDQGVPLVFVRDVRTGDFSAPRSYVDEAKASQLGAHIAEPGDVLITKMGAPPGDSCIYTGARPGVITADCIRFRPTNEFDRKYVSLAIGSPQVRAQIEAITSGVAQRKVSLARFRAGISLPVPGLAEQRRIVEQLEGHLSCLDAGAAYAKSCLRRKESLRTSLLAENYIGQLTSLGHLSVKAGYGTSTKCEAEGPGVPVVRIPNLVGGSIDLSDEKRAADSDLNLSKYMLEPDDLLIVRTNGSVDLIGRAAVVQPGIEAAFASYLIRYRLNTAQVRPRWVSAMLSSPQVRTRLESLAASSAGQHNLSLGKLDMIELPVPTMDVQDARLRRLDAIESDIARLTTACNQLLTREASLRAATLTAAFSGRLTKLRDSAVIGIESA